jgi:hypothetical protein
MLFSGNKLGEIYKNEQAIDERKQTYPCDSFINTEQNLRARSLGWSNQVKKNCIKSCIPKIFLLPAQT